MGIGACPDALDGWADTRYSLPGSLPGSCLEGALAPVLFGFRRPVAHAADGLDQVLVRRAELRAEPADVDVHRARAAVEVEAPYLPEERGAREDTAGARGEVAQQLELLEGQVERLPGERDLERGLVERERSEADRVSRRCAAALAEHREAQRDLRRGSAGGKHLVRHRRPGEPFEVRAFDDRDPGNAGSAVRALAEDRVALSRVLRGVDEDEP